MAGSKPLFVVGSVNADLLLESRLPLAGETVSVTGGGYIVPGGKGANQAAAAALMGHATRFVGQTGRDAPATLLRDALAACGVELTHCAAVDAPTGQAVIVLQPGGENSIILVPGANAAWSAPPEAALAALEGAGVLLLQREVPESVSLAAARAAHAAGVPVILDAGGDETPLGDELLSCVSILSPNETELARLTALPTAGEEQVLVAAAALQARGVRTVLVKLGPLGSLLVPPPPEKPLRQPAFQASQVVDTTGAGDCFTAAFAVALLEGRSNAEALRFASAAACICVGRMGAMPSLPSRKEVEELLASTPVV
jgi:ribokinase